jgi:hypothetical protein
LLSYRCGRFDATSKRARVVNLGYRIEETFNIVIKPLERTRLDCDMAHDNTRVFGFLHRTMTLGNVE